MSTVALSDVCDEPKVQEKQVSRSEAEQQLPKGLNLAVIMLSLYATMFLVALDRTIIATAVPRITDQFDSLDDISWYASAYLVTACATQLLWGRIYTFYSTKAIYLTAVGIFEVGSAICGAAPNSTVFIMGRAIAGIGSVGIFFGSSVILMHVIPLAKRPVFIGFMGAIFGISSIIGPLMGGAFTDRLSWRWCFYINLPIAAVTLTILVFFLHVQHTKESVSLRRQIIRLDPLGTVLFLPGVTCFLLALQWGGTTYAWNNSRLIALFVLAGVLAIGFIAVQTWRQDDATVPPRIIKNRSIACGMIFTMCIGGGMVSMLYSIALWFQAVKDTTAVQSGINSIPMVLGLVAGSILAGAIVTCTGYYVPWMFVSTILASTGSGLITTFTRFTGHSEWIGYQALFGLGLGTGMLQPNLAAQTILQRKDVPIGMSLMFFSQSLGGAIFVCIGTSLFTNHLASALPGVSGIDPGAILAAGATEIAKLVSPEKLNEILTIYNDALVRAFTVVVAMASFMVLPALGMQWRTVKEGGLGGSPKSGA